jgi:competence ComEA-like helix-hairpin-helix protein
MKRDPERGMRAFPISRTLLFSLLVAMPSTLPLSGCVKRTRNAVSPRTFRAPTVAPTPESQPRASELQSLITTEKNSATAQININTASVKELEKLPGIGKGLAERIIEHREKFGPFRRAEHLIMVRGISDKRFRALRDSITVE